MIGISASYGWKRSATGQLAKNLAQFEERSDKKNSNIIIETLIIYCNAVLEFFNKL